MSRSLHRSWSSIALLALVWALSSEALRALLPMLVFGVRDRFRWSALGAVGSLRIGALAIALFALAFLAGPLRRALGARRGLALTVCALAGARLGLQLWSGDALGHLALIALVLVSFMLLLPSALTLLGGTTVVLGILSGCALDSALHGVLGTYDLLWRDGFSSLLLVTAMVAALLFFLSRSLADPEELCPTNGFLRWTVIGPFLYLQLLILGNVPRITVLTGWRQETASLWLLCGQVVALLAVVMALGHLKRPLPRALFLGQPSFAIGVALAASLAFPWAVGGTAAALLFGGQVLAALLLARALAGGGAPAPLRDRSAFGHGVGMLLLVLLFFLYYGSYDLSLPLPTASLAPLAALGMALAAWSAGRQPTTENHVLSTWPWFAAAVCLLLLPVGRLAIAKEPPLAEGSGFPLRVMSYNLHCGYGPDGLFRLEQQAQAIEEQGVDVVALQEVSRGWVINGSMDMLEWLSRRLGMTYSFAPTADPLWGNAVLSRRPLSGATRLAFTHGGVHIRRGLLEVEIPIDHGEPLRLITSHYHHRSADSLIRVEESKIVLDFWQGRPRTILLGDLNAPPETPEMGLLRSAGFADVLELAGVAPGHTFRTGKLEHRLDYIWITPDLAARDAVVSPSTASDHLAVVATLEAVGDSKSYDGSEITTWSPSN